MANNKNKFFHNLGLNITSGVADAAIGAAFNYRGYKSSNSDLKLYSSTAYKSMYAYVGMRTLAQITTAQLNELYPNYIRKRDKERYNERVEKLHNRYQQIITENNNDNTKLLNPENVTVMYRGKQANEALVLWVNKPNGAKEGESVNNKITVYTYWDKISSHKYKGQGTTGYSNGTEISIPGDRAFLDLGPSVQASSGNNIILTKVQGRDYSRKEMISKNDITFNVRGNICSNYPDVYPYEQVSNFLAMMRHTGIISVYNLMFQQFNVNRILIKDYSLNAQPNGCKNVQPYSFTCVAVESQEITDSVIDTISVNQNLDFTESERKSGWAAVGEKLLNQLYGRSADFLVDSATGIMNHYAYEII